MITNERQYKISKKQLEHIRKAIEEFDFNAKALVYGSEILAEAEVNGLKSQEEELKDQLIEYENLKSGQNVDLGVYSLANLPLILIKARIAQNMTQRDLAELLGLKEQQIQRYESEQYARASLRRLLEIAEALKVRITESAEISNVVEYENAFQEIKLDWERFPIKEMYRRGWFEGTKDSLDSVMKRGKDLIGDYIFGSIKKPSFVMHRKRVRSGSNCDMYALLAWECRILSLARKEKNRQELNKFDKNTFSSEWISQFVQLSNQSDGPKQAREILRNVGILLIIEPYLEKTFLDGAALLFGDTPIIGLTLRYDRLDNFWFVLMHELMHILHHIKKGKIEGIFDNLDMEDNEKIEIEADKLAAESLIPESEWNSSLAQYTRSEKSIAELSERLGISMAIVAGRIRHEANNYVILHDLIGQGEVRRQFDEVIFG